MEKGRLSSENLFLYKNEILPEKRVERERDREREPLQCDEKTLNF